MFIFGAGYEKDTLTDITREAAAVGDFYGSGITLPTTGRRGTKCLRLKGGQTVTYALNPGATELFIGMAFLAETGAAVSVPFLTFYNSGAGRYGFSASVNSGRRLVLSPDASGGPVTWTSATPVAANGWYHLGLHVKLHASAGVLAGYFGGASSPDAAAANGKTSDSALVADTFVLSGPGSSNDGTAYRFGDIYINDGRNDDGLGNNVLWGDYKAVGRRMSVNGTNTGLSRSTGTNDATLVSDDSDATYLYGLTGRTTMVPVPLGFSPTNIKGRVVKIVADKEDATMRTLDLATKVGATDYDHATETGDPVKALEATNKRRYAFLQPADPSTGAAWADAAAIDAAEIGPLIA